MPALLFGPFGQPARVAVIGPGIALLLGTSAANVSYRAEAKAASCLAGSSDLHRPGRRKPPYRPDVALSHGLRAPSPALDPLRLATSADDRRELASTNRGARDSETREDEHDAKPPATLRMVWSSALVQS
jgi:hypothetical protein